MTKAVGCQVPRRAMVLAAGLGMRMRPFTDGAPKPLVTVGGKALIDHVLDRLVEVGVEIAVVNVHYLADQIERHVASRRAPKIIISDERGSTPAAASSRHSPFSARHRSFISTPTPSGSTG